MLLRPFNPRPSTRALLKRPQKRIAIIIPAWDEAAVIASMLENNIARIDYENYDIFVGVYRNDAQTRRAVDGVIETHPNVIRADVQSDGPTSKADALNWTLVAIKAHEAKHGIVYDAIAMHDAEDVIHPATLRVYNWYCERSDMLQLPVLSLPRQPTDLVGGHYMDEFAEWHTKDLAARARLSGIVPSAGVATCFSRRAIDTLLNEGDGRVFNTDSLTEDYDIGQRLRLYGLRGEFVRQYVVLRSENGRKRRKELVATKEYFPNKFNQSIRQKSRWVLGISILGWRDLGWFGSTATRWFLYRDRKAIWTAPTGMIAYAIVVQVLLYELVIWLVPGLNALPALIERDSWVWGLILVNFWFLLNRVIHRMIFTGVNHGWLHALIAPIRIVVGNFIAFGAVWRAARLYILHLITGKPLTWDKTDHVFPSVAEIEALYGEARYFKRLERSSPSKRVREISYE